MQKLTPNRHKVVLEAMAFLHQYAKAHTPDAPQKATPRSTALTLGTPHTAVPQRSRGVGLQHRAGLPSALPEPLCDRLLPKGPTLQRPACDTLATEPEHRPKPSGCRPLTPGCVYPGRSSTVTQLRKSSSAARRSTFRSYTADRVPLVSPANSSGNMSRSSGLRLVCTGYE